MFHFLKRVISLSIVLSLVCVSFLHADAKTELKDLHKFELTEKRLDQYIQSLRNMVEAYQKNPKLAEQAESVNSNASLNEMIAAIEKNPAMKSSIERTGMTAREFIYFQMALFSAAMGHWVVQQGQKLPAEFSPEHVKFYATHEQKVKALQKEWEELEKKMKPNKSEDGTEEEYEESESEGTEE